MKYKFLLVFTLLIFGCTETGKEVRITQGDKVWEVCDGEAMVMSGRGEIGFYYNGRYILLSGTWQEEEIGSCTFEDGINKYDRDK